jgi:hypothetical protein
VVGAAVWVGLHVTLAVLFLEHVAHLVPYLCALVILLAGTTVAVQPLWSQGPPHAVRTAMLVVLPPVIETMNVASLESGTVVTYANWAAGATGVMLASLVFTRHGRLGCLSGAGVVIAQLTAYVLDPPTGGASVTAAVLVSVPPQLWLLGAWGVRRVLSGADRVAHDYRARAAVEAAAGIEQVAQLHIRDERLRELEAEVLPFLTSVATATAVDEAMMRRAATLSAVLRDGLRARALLDATVREIVTRLRQDGVSILLSSDTDAGPLVDAVRAALPSFLARPGLISLVLRVTGTPAAATLIMEHDESTAGPDLALPTLPHWLSATSTHLGATLVVELSPRADPL